MSWFALPTWRIDDIEVPKKRLRPLGDIQRLAESIEQVGLLHPITVTSDGVLVSGLHRLEACRSLGWEDIPVHVVQFDVLRRELAEIDENLVNTPLTRLERSQHLQRRMDLYEALHPETKAGLAQAVGMNRARGANVGDNLSPTFTEDTARTLGMSQRSIQREIQIANSLSEEEQECLSRTPLADSQNDLLDLAREKDPEMRATLIEKVVQGAARNIKEARAKIRLDEKLTLAKELNSKPLPPPQGRFHVIVVDPPWRYEKRARDATHRGRNPYPDMSFEEICALPISELAEDHCILWLWTTNAFLRPAFECLDTWGFEYKTDLVWAKNRMGTGDWLRGKTEHCFLAVKGKPVTTLTHQTTLLEAPVREHSRKPNEFYELVEGLCPGSRLELFARQPRHGWQVWGAETEAFNTAS